MYTNIPAEFAADQIIFYRAYQYIDIDKRSSQL